MAIEQFQIGDFLNKSVDMDALADEINDGAVPQIQVEGSSLVDYFRTVEGIFLDFVPAISLTARSDLLTYISNTHAGGLQPPYQEIPVEFPYLSGSPGDGTLSYGPNTIIPATGNRFPAGVDVGRQALAILPQNLLTEFKLRLVIGWYPRGSGPGSVRFQVTSNFNGLMLGPSGFEEISGDSFAVDSEDILHMSVLTVNVNGIPSNVVGGENFGFAPVPLNLIRNGSSLDDDFSEDVDLAFIQLFGRLNT